MTYQEKLKSLVRNIEPAPVKKIQEKPKTVESQPIEITMSNTEIKNLYSVFEEEWIKKFEKELKEVTEGFLGGKKK